MRRRYQFLLYSLMALIVLAALGLGAIVILIRSGLQRYSDRAVARFPGDRIQALIAVADCESCDLRDRNNAVWALGQMQAGPALATLKKHYDGRQCEHAVRLCQSELQKAIRMIETRRERSGPLWRVVAKVHQPWH